MAAAKWLGGAANQRLRQLDRVLGMDRPGCGERHWLMPTAVLIGTILAFFTIGQITAAPLYVSLPNGIIIAFVMAGLAVACVSVDRSDAPPDDPPQDEDAPVLGSPAGPWTLVAHLGPDSRTDPTRDAEPSPAARTQRAAALSKSAVAGPR